MQELTEIESPVAHACAQPRIERWNVLEPVTGRWSWMTAYLCCDLVSEDAALAPTELHAEEPALPAKKAA